MFSLIITIISIALVAALALATLYYGGDAFNKGTAQAEAARIMNQGQQLMGAADLYYADKNEWPASPQVLEAEGYLKKVPVAAASMDSAYAQTTLEWTMPEPGKPVFTLAPRGTDVCRSVNKLSYGLDGILPKALTGLASQCYGETMGAHIVVFAKSGVYLEDAMPPAEVDAGAIPPVDDPSWVVLPGEQVSGGTPPVGGGGGGGVDPGLCVDGSALKTNVSIISSGSGASYSIAVNQSVSCSQDGPMSIADTIAVDYGTEPSIYSSAKPTDFIELFTSKAPTDLGVGDYSHYYASGDYPGSGSAAGGVLSVGSNYSDVQATGGFEGYSAAYDSGTRFSLAKLPVGTPLTLQFMRGPEAPNASFNFAANGTGNIQLCVTWVPVTSGGRFHYDPSNVSVGACPAPT